MMLYLDHAATRPLRSEAKQAMLSAMELFGNPSSVHSVGMEAAFRLKRCRERVAEALGCLPEEVIFTSGGTEANTLAIRGVCAEDGARDRLAISAFEHDSVYKAAEASRFRVELLPVGQDGVVSADEAKRRITEKTRLVSCMHAHNELGTIQPIRKLGELCRQVGALFHTDAVQTAGQLPIAFDEGPADLLSLSAHKFGGPKGIGALLCRKGVVLSPLLSGGMQESGRRAGTESLLLICGMTEALCASLAQAEQNARSVSALRDELERALCALGGIPNGAEAERMPGFINIRFPGQDAQALLHALDLHGICISAGAACHAAQRLPSRSLLVIGLTEEQASQTVRITLGEETTREDCALFLRVCKELIKQ